MSQKGKGPARKTIKITEATYKELIKSKAMAEASTERRWTIDQVIRGLLNQAPEIITRVKEVRTKP